jgi:hypothetical protein
MYNQSINNNPLEPSGEGWYDAASTGPQVAHDPGKRLALAWLADVSRATAA